MNPTGQSSPPRPSTADVGKTQRPSGLADASAAWFSLASHLPDPILLVTPDGTIAEVAGGRRQGEHAALVGRAFLDLLPEDRAGLAKAALKDALSPGLSHTLELAWTPAQGSARWCLATFAPVLQGGRPAAVLVTTVDITERRAEQERGRRAQTLLSEIEQVANVGIWDWDPKEPHASWSPQLFRIYGLDPKTHVPTYQDYLTRVHPDDRERVVKATEGAFRDFKSYSHDERIFRPDGSIRHLHTWAHAVVATDGTLARLVGVCQDITNRVEAEAEIEVSRRQLAITEKLSALGSLVSGVGHEIRTPLTYILTNLYLLKQDAARLSIEDPELTSSIRRHSDSASEGVRRIERLVGQLRRFAKPDLAVASVGVHKVVLEALELYTATRRADAPVEADLQETPAVTADGTQIQQVVLNLLNNAADASPSNEKILLRTRVVRGGVEIEVEDHGTGIPDDVRPRLFDPFFTTKKEGTGLGLSISRRIVEAHGGALRFTSAPGHGTTFTVFLPVPAPPATGGPAQPGPAPASP